MSSLLVIISDSHDNEDALRQALIKIRKINPLAVIHCGDFQSPKMLEYFVDLPFYAVLGNCDGPLELFHETTQKLGLNPLGTELELDFRGKKIYATHGHLSYLITEMADAGIYSYIFHGHTHIKRDEVVGKTRIINPGALYRAKEYTFATLDLENDQLSIITV